MKKLLVLVAASALALTACTKSADSLQKEAEEIVTEQGTIPTDRIVDAFDLYEQILDKAIVAFENINMETGDGMEEAAKLANALEIVKTGLAKTDESNGDEFEEQYSKIPEATLKRIVEKEEKFEDAYNGFMFGK